MRSGAKATGQPRPYRPRLGPHLAYAAGRLVKPSPFYRSLAAVIERHARAAQWFVTGERVAKEKLFGCRMCGQCALPVTGYACPMTCPKQLRNGPCGGVTADGRCEVYPDLPCVWVTAFERAERTGHGGDLDLLQRPVDHREAGRSSWVNYWQGRDTGLWVTASSARAEPLHRGENRDPRNPGAASASELPSEAKASFGPPARGVWGDGIPPDGGSPGGRPPGKIEPPGEI